MTQQLTALLPFPGAQSQVPVPVLGSSQSVTTVPGDSAPSSGLCGALHMCAHRHTQIHNTHTQITKFTKWKVIEEDTSH